MNIRKLWLTVLFLTLVICMIGAGMVGAAGRGVGKDTIKLGLVLVKTGPVAALGLPEGEGMTDYLNYLNEKGGINGRKIEFIWEDDQFEAPKSQAAVKKLIHRDKVLTIISTGGTNQTLANMNNISKYKITNIPNALAVEFFKPLKPYIFAIGATYESQYSCIVDYIVNDMKLKEPRIGVLYEKKEYGKMGLAAIKKRAAKYNIPVVAELVLPTGAVDAGSQVLTFKKEKANVVITCSLLPSAITYLKTAQKHDYWPTVFGFNWATDDMLVKACGEAAKNYIGVNFVGAWTSDEPGAKLARELAKKNNRQIKLTSLYMHGVGTAWLFGEAMKRAGKDLTPESLKKAMETLQKYETGGIYPPVNYSSKSHAPAEMVRFFKADVAKKCLVPVTEWRKPK